MAGSHKASDSLSDQARSSIDSEHSVDASNPPQNGSSRHASADAPANGDEQDALEHLRQELDKSNKEKEALQTQYRNLLAKLTQMRNTLGNKLQQDAEELDRREQLIQQLSAEKDDLSVTVEALKGELITSHEEAERASTKLDAMRSRVLQESAQESIQRDKELRETQIELERCRMERDEWERTAQQEQVISEEARSSLEELQRELEQLIAARAIDSAELSREKEKTENLESVLHDFQADKDRELKQAVKEYESQLLQVTQSLAEYKHRAITAEMQLEESQSNITRTQELEKEIKDKKLLIDKLRHEAVIINEHLIEALRRLRRNSSDANVDRRLVTNVLLQFLTTPRTDGKRFEMLSLLSSILSWNDQEREKAGLQRIGTESGRAPSFWSRTSNVTSPKSPADLEKSDETESFSRLWVEFLLTEAGSGDAPAGQIPPPSPTQPRSSMTSIPSSPFHSPPPQAPRRLASFGSAGMASSPNLLGPPPRKGKEREKPIAES